MKTALTIEMNTLRIISPEPTARTLGNKPLRVRLSGISLIHDEQNLLLLAMRGTRPAPPVGGWEATVGMFADDPMMDRIIETGRQIRESERHE